MGVWYCRREDVQQVLDAPATSRINWQLDRLIESKSRAIEERLHREFAPTLATRYFPFPNDQMGRSWRIWLDRDELISANTVTSGGHTVSSYYLEPANIGPPYDRLEVNLGSTSSFDTGSTYQRNIAINGIFAGAPVEDRSIGALSSTLGNTVGATANATWTTPRFGVGDVLLIDSERVTITGRNMSSSAQTLQTPVGASTAETTIAVTSGASFLADTVLLLDSERMLVVDVAGNNLIVKRAWDGSVLASHSGSTIYTYTGITLDRAQLGTTIASHSSSTTIYQWQVPGPVRQLCVAEVLNAFEQEASGYARSIGSGDNVRNAMGVGIEDIRRDVMQSHGRQLRMSAV